MARLINSKNNKQIYSCSLLVFSVIACSLTFLLKAGNVPFSLRKFISQEELNKKFIESVEKGFFDKNLLCKGVDINALVENSETPLIKAVKTGNPKLVMKLIKHGAEIDMETPSGNTALAQACDDGNLEIVNLILRGKLNLCYQLPLLNATHQGHTNIVQKLLTSGANPNITTIKKGNPLVKAASKGYVPIIKILIEEGAQLDLVDNTSHFSHTALAEAIYQGQLEAVKVLIKAGASLNFKDECNRISTRYGIARQNANHEFPISDYYNDHYQKLDINNYLLIESIVGDLRQIHKDYKSLYSNTIDISTFELFLCHIFNSQHAQSLFEVLKSYAIPDITNECLYNSINITAKKHSIDLLEKYYNGNINNAQAFNILVGNKKKYIKTEEGQLYDFAKINKLKNIGAYLRHAALISYLFYSSSRLLNSDVTAHIISYKNL